MRFPLSKTRLVCVLLVMAAVTVLPPAAIAAPKKGALKSKITKAKQIKAQIRAVKQKIEIKEGEKRTVIGQLTITEAKLETAQGLLSDNKIKLFDAQTDLQATVRRLEQTRKQLARRRGLLARRVTDIYEGEDLNFVNVVLGSSDMWTFLTRAYYLQRILNSDTQLISEIRSDERQIEKDKANQTRRVAQIQGLQVKLEAQRNEISGLADAKRSKLEEIEHSKDLMQQALDELEAKSQEIQEQIRRIQSSPRGRARYAQVFRGGLCLPVSGSISSRFGYRVHPVTGVYKLHTGVDIRCSTGTPVHAAANGVVILAGWMGAYGYAVVIDHGGGVSTLYGHNSRLLVSVGETVRQGQVISKSGSTGYSTGPHCHFEKRVNGTPVNPL